jgi:hypothetical protein
MNFEIDRFIPYFRLMGYGLFVLVCLDYAVMLIPPQFTNPNWEFQTIGSMVEVVWAPVMGSVLAFFPKASLQEFNFRFWMITRVFSWFVLGLATLHFLMAPLLLVDAARIYHANSAQINAQILQLDAQTEEQLQKIKNLPESELNELLSQLQQKIDDQTLGNTTPRKLREKIINDLKDQTEGNKKKLQKDFEASQLALIKQTVKWFLGTIVAGFLMLNAWKLSREVHQSWINLLQIYE